MVMIQITCFMKLWIRLILLLAVEGIVGEQRFAIEPLDQTAIIGSRVTLPCRVVSKVGALQWTKDDFALGTHRSLTEFFRYAMIGSDDEGDYSLAIEPITLDDDAKYQCQVSSGPRGEPAIRSRFAKLTVLVPPEKPRIIQGSALETTEDSEIELECVSYGGKPAAEITWIDGLGNVVVHGMRYTAESIPDSRLFVAKSVLRVIPKKEHHNTTFVCQAQNEADRTYQSAKIKLFVRYAPKVSVMTLGETHSIIEGTDARFICEADANPPEVSYRWYINQQQVISDSFTELIIPNISRSQHDSIVKCEARNLVGKSEDSQTLDISYGPKFRHKPHSIEAEIGSTVNLVCDVDGNPIPDITWIHGNDRIVGKSSNLTISVSQNTIGRYYCSAHVNGFPEIGAEASVRVKKRPTIIRDDVQFGIPGDSIRLECAAYSVPAPEKTRWAFNGREIQSGHQDFSMLDVPLPEGIKSTLLIRESKQEHYGVYNCSVTNQYGTDVAQIVLKPQKNFPMSMILIVIMGSLVIIITFIMIVMLCQRKEKKPLRVESNNLEKHCKGSDKSSNVSEMKLEIRTGSSASNINCESDYGTGRDNDSIITRVAVPLAGPVPVDQRYSINRFSYGDYGDPIYPSKEIKNNGYLPYVDYIKDYSPTATLCNNNNNVNNNNSKNVVPSMTTPLDLRYSAAYGNPYLKSGHTSLFPPPPIPPSSMGNCSHPPPYNNSNNSTNNSNNLRNGSVPPQLTSSTSKLLTNSSSSISPSTSSSQYITAPPKQQVTTKCGTQATHV